MYSEGFTRKKWVLGFFMLTRGALWFIHMIRQFRLGIQLLPLLLTNEVLFSNFNFAWELVEWTLTAR